MSHTSKNNPLKPAADKLRDAGTRIRSALTESPDKVRNRAVAASCTATLAVLLGVGVWCVAVPSAEAPTDPAPVAQAEESSTGDQDVSPVQVPLGIQCEGYTAESSPLVVHVEQVVADGDEDQSDGTEQVSAPVDYYHAVTPAEVADGTASLDLEPGTYTVSWISPINKDGSIYKVPEPSEVVVIAPSDVDVAESPKVEAKLEPVAADQVTKEDLDKIQDALKDAVSKGDDTLSGDAGTAATDKAGTNAGNSPVNKPAEEKPAEEKPAEEQKPAEENPAQDSQDNSSNTGGSNASKPSGNAGSSSSNSNNGGTSSSGSTPQQPTKKWVPEKGHNEPVYENVWVVDKERVDTAKCNGCGKVFDTVDAWGDHDFAYCERGDYSHGTYTKSSKVIEVGGHYEKKQTGTKWVVDVPGHWE